MYRRLQIQNMGAIYCIVVEMLENPRKTFG
jgi:hypothetical protein